MIFRTARSVLVAPVLMGGCALALSVALYPASGLAIASLTPQMRVIFSVAMLLLSGVFLSGAWRLYHYRLEADVRGLAIAARGGVMTGLIPWGEIDRLRRYTLPKGRGALYEVKAGKRHVGFSSQLFPNHATLASLIAEHTGHDWEAVAGTGKKKY